MSPPSRPVCMNVTNAAPAAPAVCGAERSPSSARQNKMAGMKKRQVLQRVHPFVLDRGAKEHGCVPQPHRQSMNHGRPHRGRERPCQPAQRPPDWRETTHTRNPTEPHANATPGDPMRSSGGARPASMPCCAMWAESSVPPSASSGEISARIDSRLTGGKRPHAHPRQHAGIARRARPQPSHATRIHP